MGTPAPDKQPPHRGKRPAYVVEQRIVAVCRMIAEGRTDGYIKATCSEAWSRPVKTAAGGYGPAPYPCTRRGVETYITRARARIAVEGKLGRSDITDRYVAELWARIRDPGTDPKRRDEAWKEMAKVAGAYASQKVALTDSAGNDVLPASLREAVLNAPDAAALIDQMRRRQLEHIENRAKRPLPTSAGTDGHSLAPINGTATNGHQARQNGHKPNGNGNGKH